MSFYFKDDSTFRMLFRQIGGLLIILGFIMILPLLVSLIFAEYYSALGFFISFTTILSVGIMLYRGQRSDIEPLNRHALIIAAFGWFLIAAMGALPFILIAYITPMEVAQKFVPENATYISSLSVFKNPLHAFFESMSGFTTTGLSMAIHEPSIGKGLLFYRSLSQWVGGAGFIVLALAVFGKTSGRSAILLYGSESTGERLRPTIIETTRSIWKLYLGLTVFSFIILFLGTWLILPGYPLVENIFDSINHAMTGQSTGGFSTLDDSILGYQSPAMEYLYIIPMILGALSLPFYFRVIYEKQFDQFWKNIQTRAILIASVIGGVFLSFILMENDVFKEPFRTGIFQYISALTTTGWQTSDIMLWDSTSILFIVTTAMIVGGAAGATVGGLKIIRVLLIVKGLFWHVNSYFLSDNAVRVTSFNQKRMLPEEMNKELAAAATFSFIYLVLVLTSTIATHYFAGGEYTLAHALFETASAQGTVGLSCGITNPLMSPVLETIYIIQMWAGRLEIIPVLVLIRTIFIGTKPKII